MMGIIYIKGRREPIYVDEKTFDRLQEAYLDKNKNEEETIKIRHTRGSWSGEWKDIRSMEFQGIDPNNDLWDARKQEMIAERAKYSKLTPHQRAKFIGKFKLWWGIHYGERIAQDPPHELIAKAIKAQEKWYAENPKVIYPNRCPSSVFESIMPKNAKPRPKELLKSMPEASELAQTSDDTQDYTTFNEAQKNASEPKSELDLITW